MYVLELAGEDDGFAIAEAENAAVAIDRLAPGLALARSVDSDRLRGLAYTRRASEFVGRTAATIQAAETLLEAQPIDRRGTVAVRARDIRGTAGIDTRAAERALGSVLTGAGLAVDLDRPDHELRALFAAETCVLGWLVAESYRDYGTRAPTDKPFFQPGSIDPLEARAVCNLAQVGPGMTVLDPLCGTGGLLVEAGLLGASVIGVDAQQRMVRGAQQNFTYYLGRDWAVVLGDAAHLPVANAIEAVVTDVPYGRQSAVAGRTTDSLVIAVLAEVRRIAPRAVVVADRDRTAIAQEVGWSVRAVFERRVHRSLTRYVHVLAGTHG